MSTLSPIRVAPSGRYFETVDDGEPFLFFGPNDAIPWPGLNGLFQRRDLDSVDAYLATLAENGVTILRLMLEYAHREHRYFEKPVGRPVPAMVRLWDDLFALCEEHGLRVLLAPWDNFWMARRWGKHPYNAANGGPAPGPDAFFTDEATIRATENRFRFVIERWGGSGVIAAWDLFNEIHPYWGGTVAQQSNVIARVSETIRTIETRTWGFTRPQTVSVFGPDPQNEYADLVFRHPSLDFATTHVYESGAIDHPTDTIAPARAMAYWVRHGLAQTPPTRPFTDTEHGPIHLFNDHHKFLPEPFDDEYERRLMWAHLASGGAGGGMRWPARDPHVLTGGMKRTIRSLADFSKIVDWRTFASTPLQKIEVDSSGDAFACGDAHQAVAYVVGPATCLTLPAGGAAGAHGVHLWNPIAGRPASGCLTIHPDPDGRLRVPLPPDAAETAVAIRIPPR